MKGDIGVPAERVRRVFDAVNKDEFRLEIHEVALVCLELAFDLSEHPIIPTESQSDTLNAKWGMNASRLFISDICEEWQRQMFRRLQPTMAQIIANKLFHNGAGTEADRLVLTSRHGQDLGGWCKKAVIDQIEEALSDQRAKDSK